MDVGTGDQELVVQPNQGKKRIHKDKPIYAAFRFETNCLPLLNEEIIKVMYNYYVASSSTLTIKGLTFANGTLIMKFNETYLNRDHIKLINGILSTFFNPKNITFNCSIEQKMPPGIDFPPNLIEGLAPLLRHRPAMTQGYRKYKNCLDAICSSTHAQGAAGKPQKRLESLQFALDRLKNGVVSLNPPTPNPGPPPTFVHDVVPTNINGVPPPEVSITTTIATRRSTTNADDNTAYQQYLKTVKPWADLIVYESLNEVQYKGMVFAAINVEGHVNMGNSPILENPEGTEIVSSYWRHLIYIPKSVKDQFAKFVECNLSASGYVLSNKLQRSMNLAVGCYDTRTNGTCLQSGVLKHLQRENTSVSDHDSQCLKIRELVMDIAFCNKKWLVYKLNESGYEGDDTHTSFDPVIRNSLLCALKSQKDIGDAYIQAFRSSINVYSDHIIIELMVFLFGRFGFTIKLVGTEDNGHACRTPPSVMDIIKYPLTVWVSKEPRYMQHLGNCFLNHYISFNLVDIPKPTITPIAPIADLANIPVEEEKVGGRGRSRKRRGGSR